MARRLIVLVGIALAAAGLAPLGLAQAPTGDEPAPLVTPDAQDPAPPPRNVEAKDAPKSSLPPRGGFLQGLKALAKDRLPAPTAADPPRPQPVAADEPPAADRDENTQPAQATAPAPAPAAPASTLNHFPPGAHTVALSVELKAPVAANLGRETEFKIVVKNTGTADAVNVVVRDELPPALRFVDSSLKPRVPGPACEWLIETLAAGAEKTITVRAIPERHEAFEHAATVTLTGGSRARTVVRQPRLRVQARPSSSRELRGKQVQFDITVTNEGDGPARDVVLWARLSKGLRHPQGQELKLPFKEEPLLKASIGPHETVPIPLIVDTIDGGPQSCDLSVTSPDVPDDAPEAKSRVDIEIVEPRLKLEFVKGPTQRVNDTPASYTIRVTNAGNDTARGVGVSAFIPLGAKLDDAGGGKHYAQSRALFWTIPQLEPNESREFSFGLIVGAPKVYRVDAVAELAGGKQHQETSLRTTVTGMADVHLSVTERKRALDVDEDTLYEIHLVNNGSAEATGLLVRAELSEHFTWVDTSGTEQTAAFDQQARTVLFPKIERLAPREVLDLTIKVKALKPGLAKCEVFLLHDEVGKMGEISQTLSTRIASMAHTPN